MDGTYLLAELTEAGIEEEEEKNQDGEDQDQGACGGEPRGSALEESYANVILEDQENKPLPNVPSKPTLRVMMTISSSEANSPQIAVEQENINGTSGKDYSYLSLFHSVGILSLIFKVIFHIKKNGTVRKFKGYLATLNVQALWTLCKALIEKQRNGDEIEITHKHFLDTIKKTLFFDLIEKQNGSPVHPKQEPNVPHSCVNKSTLSCILKVALAFNMTKVKNFVLKTSVIPSFFTNLRPVLVGIPSKSETMPRLDLSDIFSFLYWPTSDCNTAKDLYTKGFHCLSSAKKRIQCLTCGKIFKLDQDSAADGCCSPRRVLNFDGPMLEESMQTYLQVVSRMVHPTPFHLRPELENCLADQYLTPSASTPVDKLVESGLISTDIEGTYRCYSCGVKLKNLQGSNDLILIHAAVSIHCPHILKICGPKFIYHLRESLKQAGLLHLGSIGHQFIQHYNFRHKSVRKHTWTNGTLKLKTFNKDGKWSDAGFFLKNDMSEMVVCWCCGITLANIKENDDPWAVHFHNNENCPFLLESKPEYFLIRAGCLSLTEEQMRRFAVPVEPNQEIEPNSGIQLNVEGILDAIDQSSFHETGSISCLFEDLPRDQAARDEEEMFRLQEKHTALKKQFLCKICMEQESVFVFLPCGHLICCKDCAPAFRCCPHCKAAIECTVKAITVYNCT